MNIKRALSFVLAVLMMVSTLLPVVVIPAVAADAKAEANEPAVAHNYVSNGLVALYSGTQNGRKEHNTAAKVWEDLVGNHDVNVSTSNGNGFTSEGYQHKSAQNFFPQEIVDVINGDAFTVEFHISGLTPQAPAYCTLFNSTNDNFALFRRNSSDELEFKFSGNTAASRNKIPGCQALLQDAVVTVTYEVNGESRIYINGERMSEMPAPSAMGANDFFFGHNEGNRFFDALYKSIRIYNRALTNGEINRNCIADGMLNVPDLYVSDGLVSLFSGIDSGNHDKETVWKDLVGRNDITIHTNDTNYFTADGLRASGVKHNLPQALVDLVNGNEFTVELLFGEFESLGTDFNTFLNSTNDKFALFRRIGTNQLEFKFSGNPGDQRHKIDNGLELLQNSLITVTYKVGGECHIYVNGKLMQSKPSPNAMGADDLFIGHDSAQKSFDTTYRSMRFYNRALTAAEVKANAASDVTVTPGSGSEAQIPSYVTVAQPQTNIAGDITLVRQINTASELEALISAQKKPAVAIYTVNEKLEVLSDKGATISTVAEVLTKTEFKILSAFNIKDKASSDALVAYLKEIRFYDCFVMSTNPEVVKAARESLPNIMGVIDYTEALNDVTELTEEKCLDIRRSMKKNNGTVAILPASLCTNQMVQYLYARQVNVWARAADTPSERAQYDALLSGAIGVISDATNELLDIACNKLPKGTTTRVTLNIGHRGIPSRAPENTLEGAILSFESGANVIEIDVYLTRDGEVVIMHDGTTGRTCNKDLPMEASTLAQLKELYVNKGYENHPTYSQCRIPTLKEYLEFFKGKDCNIFIEIKSGNTAIVPAIKKLVDEYDMYGQCSVITFNEPIMAAMRKDYPEMSVGALCGGYMGGNNSESELRAVMNFIGKYNATLNPSSGGFDAHDIRASLLRGISIYPWTFQGDINAYKNHFLWGYSGLTGNNADVLGHLAKAVTYNGKTAFDAGTTLDLLLSVTNYKHETADKEAAVTILAGEEYVKVGEKSIEFTASGKVTLLLSYRQRISRTEDYLLYTQPITITIVDTAPPETDPPVGDTTETADPSVTETETVVTDGDTSANDTTADTSAGTQAGTNAGNKSKDTGCASTVGAAALLMMSVTAGAALVIGKKKRD